MSVKRQREIYWKWYLLPTKEAQDMILKKVAPKKEIKEIKKSVVKTPVKEEVKKEEIKVKEEPEIKKEKREEVQKELGIPNEELEKEKNPLFKKVYPYFKENYIEVIEYKIVRKKTEIDFILAVPSRIGSQEYYCKAKKKKKINDGDLSSAYIHGQANNLPVIFITTGEMTKKAKEMLSKDFKGMIVKKI